MTKNILVSFSAFTLLAAKVRKYKKRWKEAQEQLSSALDESQRFFKLKEEAESLACNYNVKVIELEKENKKLHDMLDTAASQRVTLERKMVDEQMVLAARRTLLRDITVRAFLSYTKEELFTFQENLQGLLNSEGWGIAEDTNEVYGPTE